MGNYRFVVVFIEIEETLVNREKIETGRFDLSATVIDLDPRGGRVHQFLGHPVRKGRGK